tara:strand:+ start:818 stop:1684 length:867 start_codon:yes stop_codon:yes gene_type:complete
MAYLNTFIFTFVPFFLAYIVKSESILIFGIPLIYICLLISYAIHWAVFIPSYIFKTEKFYDFTGMISFICVTITAIYYKISINGQLDLTSRILSLLVIVWTLRLGLFLFYRINKDGKDDRFDELKLSFSKFLMTWTLSSAWVSITSLAALTVITSQNLYKDNAFIVIGVIIWLFGFIFEVVSDFQKTKFKSNPKNNGQFIKNGLWSVCRHPNYFGEIVLWIGISVIAFPNLENWQHVSLISPLFVYLLLTKISGINLLEAKAEKKWGTSDEYKKYRSQTPQLIPKFWN